MSSWRFPSRTESVPAGRRRVTEFLTELGVTAGDPAHQHLHDFELVLTELLSNAVRVSDTFVEVEVVTHHDHVVLRVTDDHPAPAVLSEPEPTASSGRGLRLVRALAENWGQDRHDGTKTVWARFAVPGGSNLARDCQLLPG